MTALATPGLRRVQLRTTATAMLGVLVVVVIAAIILVQLFEREQVRQIDDQLRSAKAFVDRANDSGSLPTDLAGTEELAQFVDARGEVVYASGPLEGLPPLVDAQAVRPDGLVLETVSVPDVGSYRTITFAFGEGGRLTVGAPLRETEQAVDALIRSLLIGLPIVLVGVGAVIWLIVGRTLRPVDEALQRERRLVADASHDLRTPLAGVRALLETEPDDPDQIEANRRDALATLGRLEATVDDLLVLAQADGGDRRQDLVDLDEIVLRQAQLLGRGTDCRIETSAVSGGQVVGNALELERMAENVLSNAVRHASSTVAVSVRETDGRVVLRVDDDGPGIAPEDRDRVFERFIRLDESRTSEDGGAGLGLAIVREVVDAHAGSVAVLDAPLGGASLQIDLPASTPA